VLLLLFGNWLFRVGVVVVVIIWYRWLHGCCIN
jgi:hypothetical protein